MYPKCDLFLSISALFNNSRGCYLKVFIIVEFEFEVKNIDFLSKRCEIRHLNISLKIIYFQFSPFPLFINRSLLSQQVPILTESDSCKYFNYKFQVLETKGTLIRGHYLTPLREKLSLLGWFTSMVRQWTLPLIRTDKSTVLRLE